MIHIGKEIEKTIRIKRIPITEFAKRINKSRTVAYDIIQRESIDTELLSNISKVLEFDFFSLYLSKETQEKQTKNLNNDLQIKYTELLERYNQLLETKVEDFFRSNLK